MAGAIHHFDRFSFDSLFKLDLNKAPVLRKWKEKKEENQANPHNHAISSIVVQSSGGKLRVWVGSYDKSFSLWVSTQT